MLVSQRSVEDSSLLHSLSLHLSCPLRVILPCVLPLALCYARSLAYARSCSLACCLCPFIFTALPTCHISLIISSFPSGAVSDSPPLSISCFLLSSLCSLICPPSPPSPHPFPFVPVLRSSGDIHRTPPGFRGGTDTYNSSILHLSSLRLDYSKLYLSRVHGKLV